jgi:hypothetical protein
MTGWEKVTVAPHRFGGIELRLGKRELGHVHGDTLVDIPFPRRVRDEIIAAGEAEPHHILPESGWVSVFLSFRRRRRALNTIAPAFLLFGCGSSAAPADCEQACHVNPKL